jgi:hypothetical protein
MPMNPNLPLTNLALAAAVSPEVDALRAESRRWFVRSQIYMGVAAVPIVLMMFGVMGSMFSLAADRLPLGLLVSLAGGILLAGLAMLVCVPGAFYCIFKMMEARRRIQAHIEQQVRAAVQSPTVPPPMPSAQ